jgi:uncharacterized membrane protein
MRIRPIRALLARSDRAGMFAASGFVSGTFQRTLMPRSTRDQALVTGLSMALAYQFASLVQDGVESVASWLLVGTSRERDAEADEQQLRRVTLALDAAAMVGGFAVQMAFPQKRNEPLRLAAARTGGFWLAAGSASGLMAGLAEEALTTIDRRTSRDLNLSALPAPLIAGAIFATVRDIQRRRREASYGVAPAAVELSASGTGSIAMGAGIGVALLGMAQANRSVSRLVGRALDRILPGDERLWRPMAHFMWLGVLFAGLYAQLQRINHRIEEGTSKIEGAFDQPPTSALVSSGPGSGVSWETIGREGRRHVSTYIRREWIEEVMGEPAIDPVRVFVGLDSAPTEEERVQLAVDELERTGAFTRKLLIAVSPTGTGYVNYVAIESAEYFSRGDCATVTLQYSKRPSPLSLDRVWEGRRQFRMLLAAIRRKLYKMAPEDRPRLVVFGESLGAHTSQDAFIDAGTQGLQDAGVERALWIGTPALSKWKAQILRGDRPDVEPELFAEFDNFEQLEALPTDQRKALRYVLVTHGNDGVGHFAPQLLLQQPDWLGDPDTRPPGVPKSQRWLMPTTFVQTLVDMNNAMNVVPGQFDANGHDYRADLARFVREVYDLPCSDEQLARVEQALRRYEAERQEMLDRQTDVVISTDGHQAGAGSTTTA